MPAYTDRLHLAKPYGSEYFNVGTWNENMNIIDEAYSDLADVLDVNAEQVSYDNSNSNLSANNIQDAIDELAARPSGGGGGGTNACFYILLEKDEELIYPTYSIIHFVIDIHDTVYNVSFVPSIDDGHPLHWINGTPEFRANHMYEVNILNHAGIWLER